MKLLEPTAVGNRKFLTCESEPEETIDTVVLGMMSNNEIAGLLPMTVQRMDDVWRFSYDITNAEPLDNSEPAPDTFTVLRLLEQMCEVAVSLRDYAIDEGNLVLKDDCIYLNKAEEKAYLLCVPIERQGEITLKKFCEEKVRRLYSKRTQYGSLCRDLIGCLREENFDCHAFAETIKRGLALMSVQARKPEPARSNDYGNDMARDGAVLLRHTTDGRGDSSGDTLYMLERDSFEQRGTSIDLRHSRGFPSEVVDETVLVQDDDFADDAEQQTALLDEDVTSLLRNRAFLIRKSTNERIEITTDSFCIGKSSRDLDYRIEGNPAVSRYHAKIIRRENGFFIKDTDSKNHTYVDREKIESGLEIPLTDGTSVRFANEEFTFAIEY